MPPPIRSEKNQKRVVLVWTRNLMQFGERVVPRESKLYLKLRNLEGGEAKVGEPIPALLTGNFFLPHAFDNQGRKGLGGGDGKGGIPQRLTTNRKDDQQNHKTSKRRRPWRVSSGRGRAEQASLRDG